MNEDFNSTDDRRTENNPSTIDDAGRFTTGADEASTPNNPNPPIREGCRAYEPSLGMVAMKMQYRALSSDEKAQMQELKQRCANVWDSIDAIGSSAELTLAKRHIEDACMRAVRHITG